LANASDGKLKIIHGDVLEVTHSDILQAAGMSNVHKGKKKSIASFIG